jgi:hypothetical protein
MKSINKFILHVVHNWGGLTEALSAKQMQVFIKQFKDEAEDLNLTISDDELKAAIEIFDTKFKNNPNVAEKDLAKYSVNQLLRLVRTTSDTKPKDIEITPDVVYNSDDNSIVIYSGDVEGKCVTFGKGERWCITKGSYGSYRYSSSSGYPVFYLVKNNNLPSSDTLSFVAIQVRNKPEDQRYVWTGRSNVPNNSEPMSFSQLVRNIPYLADIPNLQNILKYIPVEASAEGKERKYKDGLKFNEWATDLDFEEKKQYIMVRLRDRDLFKDLSYEKFIQKVLPKYDRIADWISTNPWIIGFDKLLNNLEYLKPNNQKSIISFVNRPGQEIAVKGKDIINKEIPFDVSKKLIQANRIPFDEYFNAYVTSDGSTIVNIRHDKKNIRVDLITEDDVYDNIKLNTRTQKYLFGYPNIDEIPFDKLIKTITDFNLDSKPIKDIVNNAKESTDGAKQVINVDGKDILFDTANNTIKAYDLSDNTIKSVKLSAPGIREAFLTIAQANPNIIKNTADVILNYDDITNYTSPLNKEELIDILKEAPANVLINANKGIYITQFNGEDVILAFDSNPALTRFRGYAPTANEGTSWRYVSFSTLPVPTAYPEFLRKYNITVSDNDILTLFDRYTTSNYDSKIAFAQMDLPRTEGSNLIMAVRDGVVYIINREDPSASYKVSPNTGKLLAARLPARTAAALAGPAAPAAGDEQAPAAAPAAPAAGAPRRGRPAGVAGQAAAVPVPVVAAAGGENNDALDAALVAAGLTGGFNSLPATIRRKFVGAQRAVAVNQNAGATRRNNILGGNGRVTGVVLVTNNYNRESALYIIRLANGAMIGSIVSQPGNSHYIITTNASYAVNSPAELMAALQQRNLVEMHQYIVNDYLGRNPKHVGEIKSLLEKHIEETKIN